MGIHLYAEDRRSPTTFWDSLAVEYDRCRRFILATTSTQALSVMFCGCERFSLPVFSFFARTNLDCDLLEEFLTAVGGGKRFTGHQESGDQNAFSCCVLAGMRSMQQRRVRHDCEGEGKGERRRD